ncbi:MAG: protoheme IX farnesyltransferase [Chloroflexi bacterium]|nr:MAG: protoheme IX farnesyltransferase [Chloroflexota bacterium]MBL1194996.1 protoheme IX farnesyltransferase [Chloroflexota bacterium]NOH12284.1 protoheme IX farnesyltransferase [Chloroflexota bacterium]
MVFAQRIHSKIKQYWSLIKSLQTGLLLLTGLAGFITSRCPWSNWQVLLGVFGSLFLAISGSTVLNMWYDRDIDARMKRTSQRPLPSGQVSSREALTLGIALSGFGILWAFGMDLLYGAIVFAGLFFDVLVYTIWLKRRTAWSIVWGGISGGMPVLAGRALGTGHIDWVGLVLMAAILFWIPTHILTFSMRYYDDYQHAGIPTFPSTYGFDTTRRIIAVSSMLASGAMVAAALGIGLSVGYLRLIAVLSVGLLVLAISIWLKPIEKGNFGLFKYASLYMLCAMLLMAADVM